MRMGSKGCALPITMAFLAILAATARPVAAQMDPKQSLATLRVPEGFDLTVFASEPMITNPAAIDVDTHGRVWVAEIQWYRKAAKVPPADKIKVLEDTDADGVADKVTVFADGVFAPMSICVAGSKVYVATSPDLWVYEDADADLRADGPPRRLLTGFGGYNHDHGTHSLVLGPDHKWWMSHGDEGFDVTGTDGSRIHYRWGAMLRGELDGSRLEIIAVNFRNPYELCVSSFGEAFCSDNDNDGNQSTRVCWILEGGDYGWFGHPPFTIKDVPTRIAPGTPFGEHWHFRGHVPGHVPATLMTGFGSPCGICFYEGDAFGPEYKNAPWHTEAGPREVRVYRHRPLGYGMKATSEIIITSESDMYFRPDDICVAPDGSLYVSDWYDGGVGGHAYNDPERGRIYRLMPNRKRLVRIGKPGPYHNIPDAIEALKNPNLATQYLARERLLADGSKSMPTLERLLADSEPNYRARALWVLDRIGGTAHRLVLEQLKSEDPASRALAVRILRRHGAQFSDELLPLADDPSDEVRREVLLAIARLDEKSALDTLVKLTSTYDGTDRYQLEAINIAARNCKQELYGMLQQARKWTDERIDLMRLLNAKAAAQYLAFRLASSELDETAGRKLVAVAARMPSSETGRAVLRLLDNENASLEIRRLALDKLAFNLGSNWKSLASDNALLETFRKLLADRDLRQATLAAIGSPGLWKLAPDVARLARSTQLEPSLRQQAVAVAAKLQSDGALPLLRDLLADQAAGVRQAALNALVDLQDLRTLRTVLAGASYPSQVQTEAADRLVDSTGGALVLLRMIDQDLLSANLKQRVIARAARHPDSNVRVLYERFIPVEQRPKRLGSLIDPEILLALKGDPRRGEQIFFQSSAANCKSCHVVRGVGSAVGPDLSQIGKKYERQALLETILDPSKAIAPEYVPHLLETERGAVYAGFVMEKTDKQIVLKDAKGELVRMPASEVTELVPQKKSLMPDLVLRDVTAQDAADLLAFLSTLTEDVQSVGSFRVLGPFGRRQGNGLDEVYQPERTLANPDLSAESRGLGGKTNRWELVLAESTAGFPAVDLVNYCRSRGLRTEQVIHYLLVYADSAAEQEMELLLGSDEGYRLWVNGQLVGRNEVTREIGYAQDRIRARVRKGNNVIVIKVENRAGPSGVCLAISSPSPVRLEMPVGSTQ